MCEAETTRERHVRGRETPSIQLAGRSPAGEVGGSWSGIAHERDREKTARDISVATANRTSESKTALLGPPAVPDSRCLLRTPCQALPSEGVEALAAGCIVRSTEYTLYGVRMIRSSRPGRQGLRRDVPRSICAAGDLRKLLGEGVDRYFIFIYSVLRSMLAPLLSSSRVMSAIIRSC